MEKIQDLRSDQNSSAGPQYFFLDENRGAYAAYYPSMYLIQGHGAGRVHPHGSRLFA
jgi:hypothetical protein